MAKQHRRSFRRVLVINHCLDNSGGGGSAGLAPAMVWAAAWLGPTLPTVDHLASWGGWELGTQSFPHWPRQVPKSCMVTGDRGTQSSLLPLKARTPEVLTPSVVTFSWDTRRPELPPVTPPKHEKRTSSARESRRMASLATPKGRGAPPDDAASAGIDPPTRRVQDSRYDRCTEPAVPCRLHRFHEGVSLHGESDNSQGSCAPPIAHSRRNGGRFLLRHHEVVVVWPCLHALPSPALAAACGAFGGEPHPRKAPDFHMLPAPRSAWVLPQGAPVPTRAPSLGGGGGDTQPMPGSGQWGGGVSQMPCCIPVMTRQATRQVTISEPFEKRNGQNS